MPSFWTSPPFLLFTQLYMQSMTPHGVGYPCVCLGSAVLALSLHSLCTPSPLGGGVGWEAEKDLSLCKCFSAVMKTSLVINIVLVTNPNTVSYQLLWRKLPLSKLKTACFLLLRLIDKIMKITQTAIFLEDTTLIFFFFLFIMCSLSYYLKGGLKLLGRTVFYPDELRTKSASH